MPKMNIKNGTPVGDEHLCRRCTWGQSMTGYRESDFVVICTNTNPNFKVPFTVMDCSDFNDRHHRPDWSQMEKLAIQVQPTRASARTPGFSVAAKVQPIRRVAEDDQDEGEAARIR
jgi:hypothetical protein